MNHYSRALRRFALTHVAVAALSLASLPAWAVGLGRLNVQSALGETLKAEIDISSLSAEEAASLKARIALPEVYRTAGVEYNAVLTSTQVQLVRRADGKAYLRLSSDRAVQEPFVDVILELKWSSGQLTREYTLLFDPPGMAAKPAPAPEVSTAPVIAAAPAEPRPIASQVVPQAASQPTRSRPEPAARPAPSPAPAPQVAVRHEPRPAPVPASTPASGTYSVRPGDTLSRIAGKVQTEGFSLDQMLVGLYRANPDAFIDSNMNRLKAGAVLQVPGGEKLGEVSAAEAHQLIQAQSADFNSYRQRLAGGAPEVHQDGSERQAKGKVQTEVAEKKAPAVAPPDKLTLSKAGAPAAETKVSKESEKKDSAARVAELTRNVEELKKLSSQAKTAPATAPAASLPPAPVQVPVPVPVPVPVAAAPAPIASPVPAASQPTAASLPKPAASRAPLKTLPAPEPTPEPGLVEQLLNSTLTLPILGVLLIGGIGGAVYWQRRGRKEEFKAETSFAESRLQPDSFFGASGGQRVDTRESSNSSQSSMSYSLSQLDAIGDVDPVAEADVYLAYGRDLQAEEILKEALRANPERLAIRLKLLEVYAKRRDTKAFEQLASQLFAETQGQGEDWARVQELGRQIDPDHPLYQPGGVPAALAAGDAEHRPEPMNASTLPASAAAIGMMAAAEAPMHAAEPEQGPSSGLMDLDLDLDLGSEPSATSMAATQAMAAHVDQAPLSMDLNLDSSPMPLSEPAKAAAADLEFDLNELGDFDAATAAGPLPAEAAHGGLDFDLSSIELDLPPASEPAPLATQVDTTMPDLAAPVDAAHTAADQLSQAIDALADDEGDPLQRQLELADEFRQIGDVEGARDVLQELVGKAEGALKSKAQAMLDELR